MAQADRDKWNRIYRGRAQAWRRGEQRPFAEPGGFFAEVAELLPRTGGALDLAGGAGRFALALARGGLSVTLADISEEALRLAEERAAAAGVELHTRQVDLDEGLVDGGPWSVIFIHHFLDRRLVSQMADHLEPGGVVAMCHPTRRNLERHARPSARFLLEEGELAGLFARAGLEVEWAAEGWTAEGRHEARLLARRGPRSART